MATQTIQAKPATKTEAWSNPCVTPTLTKGEAAVTLYHAMSPTCWWSWGYYGTLSRVRLVYGNQVDMRLAVYPVYERVAEYWEKYNMDPQKLEAWAKDSQNIMGVPIATAYSQRTLAETSVPPVMAVLAAYRQGQPQGDRMCRALLRRFVVEGNDAQDAKVFREAATESGLDLARFERDLKDTHGLEHELEAQAEGFPHVPLGFYNLVVEDRKGRRVLLDNAFDPEDVLGAIEFLTGGTLVKNQPTDPVVFLKAAGPAPTIELARAFGRERGPMESELAKLESAGRLRRVRLAGADHWVAA